ncbi:hypothetical protein GEU84_020310 [Fertoebacter nigrum]|uniref:Uncharacterized protein n=1 Tax=Fertoeibacter niger TaxID=2656921 RepID=A0A8X8KQY2_9RHOB|nr:hypothetical protein [Fertoeibacter niger]NUB46740.1 hypothetical protein [Fertoeibacter niger]
MKLPVREMNAPHILNSFRKLSIECGAGIYPLEIDRFIFRGWAISILSQPSSR